MANGELSVRLRKDIPKLREIARRTRKESDTFSGNRHTADNNPMYFMLYQVLSRLAHS